MKKAKKNKSQSGSAFTAQEVRPFWIAILLVIIVVIYLPTINKSFVNYDDDAYILDNPYISDFNWTNGGEIFTHFYNLQYSPIPTLTQAVIHYFAGYNPLPYNIFTLLLHLSNVLLVFILARSIFKKTIPALFTAAVFGMHPINVESIAWASAAFKIGYYTLFFLLSLIYYQRYLVEKKIQYFWLSLIFFLASCLSKEQAVTLPLSLLILDYFHERKWNEKRLWLEKLPFFAGSVFFGMLTLAAAASGKPATLPMSFTFPEKIAISGYALSHYFFKTILPFDLSPFYPVAAVKAIGPAIYFYLVFLILIPVLAWYAWRKGQKGILMGLLFFVANLALPLLVPMATIREVVKADRYVYIASIGFAFVLGFLWMKYAKTKTAPWLFAGGLAYLLFLGVSARVEAAIWKDSQSLTSTILKRHPVPMAYVNRGMDYMSKGQIQEGFSDFNAAIRMDSNYYLAYLNRGICYSNMNDTLAAIRDFDRAIQINPDFLLSYVNRGISLLSQKKYDLALLDMNKAIEINPDNYKGFLNRGNLYSEMKKDSLALLDFGKAEEINNKDASLYGNRAIIYYHRKDYALALKDVNQALSLDPSFSNALQNRIQIFIKTNRDEDALNDLRTFIALNTNQAWAYIETGRILQKTGKYTEAIQAYSTAIPLSKNPGPVYLNLAYAFYNSGDKIQARKNLQLAQNLGTPADATFVKLVNN